MNKDVMLTLKSVQMVDNNRSETELVSEAKYNKLENGGFEITYEESEATGFSGSHTILSCYGDKYATIIRTGDSSSNLVVDSEKKQYCHYGTPYGELMVGIYTHSIVNKLDENGGELYMKYTVDINSSYVSDNEIFINVRCGKGNEKEVNSDGALQ